MKYNYAEMTKLELQNLMDANITKIFGFNEMLGDLAIRAEEYQAESNLANYQGATWAVGDFIMEYKSAEQELLKREQQTEVK